MPRHHSISLILSLLLLLGATPSIHAQESGLQYSEVTKVEVGGSLGALMSVMPGAPDETVETVYLQGHKMRTDSEDHSTIVDMGSGVMFSLDHPNKRYFRLEIGQMAEGLAGMGMTSAGMERASEDAMRESEEMADDSVEFTVEIDTDRTGERDEISGMQAERVLVTLIMEATGRDEETNEIRSGTMVLLSDIWLAESVPGMEAFDEAAREMALQTFGSGGAAGTGGGFAAAFEADPRIRVASEQAREELEELRGFPVKSTSHFVSVPEGLTFDREAALASADEPLGMDAGDLASAAGKAVAKSAAKSAAESLTGGMSGLFGRKKEEPKEEEAPEPTQMTILRGTTMIKDLKAGPIPAGTFLVPEDYEERELPSGTEAGPGQP